MAVVTRRLGAELVARGVVPENCRNLELLMRADDVVVFRYEVHATNEQLLALAEALKAVGK